jgi:D-beta-D-heptose 7-phosphate kinase/D-beta-D-heptose 1-phosphate adenosyltransferase
MDLTRRQPPDHPQISWEGLRDLPLEKFSDLRVLVLGDFMLDEYIWGQVDRISPEAPVAVVDVERETRTLGGAGNVANNLAALGAKVEVLALTGADNPAGLLKEEVSRLGIDPQGLFADPGRRTTRKTRVFANQQQVVRIDRETRAPAPGAFADWALERLDALLPELNAVILSDYGKGALTPALLREAIRRGRAAGLPVVVDPKGMDYSPYSGATVITPNQKEVEQVLGAPLDSWEDPVKKLGELRVLLEIDCLLVTQGARGMTLIHGDGAWRIPARTPREVFDVSGAGDTVAAVLTLGLAQWGDPALAANLANVAAGVVVTKKGTAPILRSELERELRGHVHLEEKIVTLKELGFVMAHLKAQGKKVVFTNGCFDLLHAGHIKFLEDSRRQGDALVVALDSDASVARVKGDGRPVIGEEQRLRILGALEVVDYVTLFDSEQLPEILQNFKPDILTKGSNYPEAEVAGREIVQGYGGEVKLLPVTETVSVSDLINRIRGE